MNKKLNMEALLSIEEVCEKELETISGAGKIGDGVFNTLTHECHMNTWQFIGTCCGW